MPCSFPVLCRVAESRDGSNATLTVVDARVKAAATEYLVAALAEARRQRIIPSRRLGRWDRHEGGPWPAYWACWEIAHSEISQGFQRALRETYPDRFGEETKFQYKDPEEYARATLRAVIAHNVSRAGTVSSRSQWTREVLEELERVATAEGQRFACLWVISDVDFTSVEGGEVGRITLIPQPSPPEPHVSQLLPEALWVGDGFPLRGAKDQGLLFASAVGTRLHYDVTGPLNDAIARFVTLLRLATASTTVTRVVWLGEPSMVHVSMPEEHVHHTGFIESRWRRVAKITQAELQGLSALTAKFDRLDPDDPTQALPAIVVAMRRYARSFRTNTTWQDSVLDLATALEACLGPSNKEEIGLTLRTRAAHLLAHNDSEQAEEIYTDVRDLYGLRSDIIHGKGKLTKDLAALWADRNYSHVLEHDRLHVLLDRWREIVRRAICARLLLGDDRIGTAPWPLKPVGGKETQVDLALVRRDQRDAWRKHIVATADAYGFPLMARKAPPLIDYLHRSG